MLYSLRLVAGRHYLFFILSLEIPKIHVNETVKALKVVKLLYVYWTRKHRYSATSLPMYCIVCACALLVLGPGH